MHITHQSYRGVVVLDVALHDHDTASADGRPLPRCVVVNGLGAPDDITWLTPDEALELAEHLVDAASQVSEGQVSR